MSHRAVHLTGRVPLYYEDIDLGESDRPPIVLVHGGGFTGSCYLSTPDGRAGWAHDFIRHGYRVIIPVRSSPKPSARCCTKSALRSCCWCTRCRVPTASGSSKNTVTWYGH